MLRLTFANLAAKKFRLLSTAVSILIGVAFLAGSMVLLDTIGRTFDDLIADINDDVDAVVRSVETVDADFGEIRGRIDGSVLGDVVAVEGVAAAEGTVQGYAQFVDPAGKAMGDPGQGPPTLGVNWATVPELNPMVLVAGNPPWGPAEVVMDRMTATDGPFAVGDSVTILLESGPRQFRVAGIATFGEVDSPLGASTALFDMATAQAVLGEPGRLDAVQVVAADGVSQQELRERLAAVMPAGIEVITGEQLVDESQSDVADALSFFNTFMLIFAVIALFVAAFIIYNTFSILVAQRTRELALLRVLGAKRNQIVAAVIIEAILVGLLASAVGVAAGVIVAIALRQLIESVGIDIPAGGIVMQPATVVIGLAVGIGVTVVSAVVPSLRASHIAPMAAIRTASTGGAEHLGRRLVTGGLALGLSLAMLLTGLFAVVSGRGLLIGLGAAGVFIGVSVLAPVVAVPFGRLVGAPIARFGCVPGELAQENTVRNPRRTATTASALMVGVGLVGAITIFAASAKASIEKIIDDAFLGDLVVDSGSYGFGGLSPELSSRLNELPEIAAASGVRLGFADIAGDSRTIFGVDPATMGSIVDVGVVQGSVVDMGPTDIGVYEPFASDRGWQAGDTVEVRFAETGPQQLTVAVLFTKDDLTGNFFVPNSAFEANIPEVFDFQVFVLRDDDASPAAARAAVEAVAADYANAEVKDLQEYKAAQSGQIDPLLGLVYALLALAVFIALIGIANTLALSILERTRELGLLRAVGMTRRQLRGSVRWESVLIALLGTGLGAVVGLFFGWVIVKALEDQGFTELRLPLTQLAFVVLLAMVAGALASFRPSRRAARLEILAAIAE
jgi:putative ABC transport system permease protein